MFIFTVLSFTQSVRPTVLDFVIGVRLGIIGYYLVMQHTLSVGVINNTFLPELIH